VAGELHGKAGSQEVWRRPSRAANPYGGYLNTGSAKGDVRSRAITPL